MNKRFYTTWLMVLIFLFTIFAGYGTLAQSNALAKSNKGNPTNELVTAAKKISVTGVTLSQNTATLTVGSTMQLAATVIPANANNLSVKWATSNRNVAAVDSKGLVTAVGAGTATITVTTNDGGFTAACTVTVTPATATATPVIILPVKATDKSVRGTAEVSSAVILSVNGVAQPSVIAKGGSWKESGLTLAAGDLITVTAQAAGKAVSAPATAYVVAATGDMVPPIVQLIGSNPDSVTIGSIGYADPGAVANDVVSGDVTASIVITGTVNSSLLGSYVLTYTGKDAAGNTASITRTVNVVNMLDPTTIQQFVTPMLIPWAMPKSPSADPSVDYYEIAMRQFNQQILPVGMPSTTVWGYGSATAANAVFHAPSLTIEAQVNRPVRVKWINGLVDQNGNYLPHLLPIDQTLHWANPVGGLAGRDMAGTNPNPYVGPVPIVTHVHGAHVVQESDGYPEAWYLPAAKSIPAGYATTGTYFDIYKMTASSGAKWMPGSVVYDYSNDQHASTIWYHDHAMGMTRTNVYAGPAGFYLLRGGPTDQVFTDPGRSMAGTLPSGAFEIPVAIQDRTFNEDGSLFYSDSRTFFDEFTGPYIPNPSSDIAPIWNPEFFGDTIIANGNTWPYQTVEQKQYRFRFLNGSQSRTLILKLSNGTPFWQIGSDGGFLDQPVHLNELLMGPAERADILIDFAGIPAGTRIILQNIGPDGPFQGGVSGIDFPPANPATTGKVMEFRVVAASGTDSTTPASQLVLPVIPANGPADNVRQVSLNEEVSSLLPGVGPKAAVLGTVMTDPVTGMLMGVPQKWMSPITENVIQGDTETWEIFNFTMDAHPIHLHLVTFEVQERQDWDPMTGVYGAITPAQPWESGYKDTVIAYPNQVTRIKATFDMAGRYVWHCHILEHEDNEMMRPYQVVAAGQDVTDPVITILGNNPETAALNSVYIDAGATALDKVDGDLTSSIVANNMVNTSVAGMYMVHYAVTDAGGNSAMAMRTVIVQ